jgi:hypothetical protein
VPGRKRLPEPVVVMTHLRLLVGRVEPTLKARRHKGYGLKLGNLICRKSAMREDKKITKNNK